MDRWLKSPWFIRGLSLLFALLLYTSVSLDEENTSRPDGTIFPSGSNDVGTLNNVPLQVMIDEEKYVVEGVPQYVNVTMEGPTSVVTPAVRQRNFDVFVDLMELEPGEHTVPVKYRGISNKLRVYIEPEEVRVKIEKRLTEEFAVDVEILNQNELDDGVILGDPVITPGTVEITGSHTEVNKVTMVKAIVDVKDVNEQIRIDNAPVKVYDEQGNELNVFVYPSTVQVVIPVDSTTREVPVTFETINELPEGLSLESIKLEPETVTLFGTEQVLQNIENVGNLEVDLSEISEDETIEFTITLPGGVIKAEPGTVKVTVDVEETRQRTFENMEIQAINVPEGREVTFLEPEDGEMEITVSGTENQIEQIEPEDFEVTIDLANYIEGEFSVPISVQGPEHIDYTLNVENARIRLE